MRDDDLVVAAATAHMNGLDPISDVRREPPLVEISRVELLDEATHDE